MYYNPEIKDRNFGSKWLSLRILESKASLPKKHEGPGTKPRKIFYDSAKKRIGEGGWVPSKSERHVIYGDSLKLLCIKSL